MSQMAQYNQDSFLQRVDMEQKNNQPLCAFEALIKTALRKINLGPGIEQIRVFGLELG